MTSKIIEQQLSAVEVADLSHYDETNNCFIIPKKCGIKIEINSCYILKLKDSAFHNAIVTSNWNNGKLPNAECYKADINSKMSGMIKILGLAYDLNTDTDLNKFWTGWLDLKDIEIIKKL